MTLDMTDNYLTWDGTATATLVLYRQDQETVLEVSHAKREALKRQDQQNPLLQLRGDEVVFRIPVALLGGHELHAEDRIIEAAKVEVTPESVGWLIGQVELLGQESSYRCICQRERG